MSIVSKEFIKNNMQGYMLEDLILSILLNKKEMEELYFCLIEVDGNFLHYIKNPTEEMKEIAIKKMKEKVIKQKNK